VTDDAEVIAHRLREARTAIGLTQQDTADTLGVHRTAVAEFESCRRKISGPELRQLTRLYRRPVAWLLGIDPDPQVDDEVLAATQGLSDRDRDAVLAFARFLAHQAATR
jgi:transcriptional regulator with XRE-family HTH domain